MTLAVVTGASRGIGRETALALARRGVEVVLVARPSPALDETAQLVAALGGKPRVEHCDLERPAELLALAERLLELGTPEVLVNNAGVIRRARIEATTLADYDAQLALNLRAPFLLTSALLSAMRRAGRGRIVNVGSVASTLGSPGAAAYAASKWGLVGFTKSLAEELAGSGLMTLVLLPGSVDTEMLVGSGFEPRMSAAEVARSITYFSLDAPLAHNGAVVEMFGV